MADIGAPVRGTQSSSIIGGTVVGAQAPLIAINPREAFVPIIP